MAIKNSLSSKNWLLFFFWLWEALKDDLGKACHTQTTEPDFCDTAYLYVRESLIPVNSDGEHVVAKQIKMGEDAMKKCDVPVAACTSPKRMVTGCPRH